MRREKTADVPFRLVLALICSLCLVWVPGARSSEEGGDLAQELTNPLADLVTVPVQFNYDRDIGVDDKGERLRMNIQPVIPFHLNDRWNLISRAIVPVVHQDDVFAGEGSQFGLGDINLSLFFSPKAVSEGGLMWGVGPIFLLPSATDELLGTRKWSAGPTAVALTMQGPWTMGLLANHVWSFAGDSDRADISNTFLQPFISYTTQQAWTLSLQCESEYNWETEQWSVPVNAAVSKLVYVGKLPVNLQAGAGYWLDSPDSGPEGWRLRFQVNFVLPNIFSGT